MELQDFLFRDRVLKILSIQEEYDLEKNAYISFSGGKDSCVLSSLIDYALPDNKIPRVFINTGIEYSDIVHFVKEKAVADERIKIIAPKKNITEMLKEKGYPFKSKEHSLYVSVYQNSGETKTVKRYLDKSRGRFSCPENLKYQFSKDFQLKISNRCCYELKKKPAAEWARQNQKSITITGMRKSEGGLRSLGACTVFAGQDLRKFNPLFVVDDAFIDDAIKRLHIELCKLYSEPFNFKRTGCKGCPYSLDLQHQLETMQFLLPAEKKQCEKIWQPIYEEYRKIGYRLKQNEISLFQD